jgi:hypothetical protein
MNMLHSFSTKTLASCSYRNLLRNNQYFSIPGCPYGSRGRQHVTGYFKIQQQYYHLHVKSLYSRQSSIFHNLKHKSKSTCLIVNRLFRTNAGQVLQKETQKAKVIKIRGTDFKRLVALAKPEKWKLTGTIHCNNTTLLIFERLLYVHTYTVTKL